MKKTIALLFLVTAFSVNAAAGDEFHLNEKGELFCDSVMSTDENPWLPCLHMGGLHIGQSRIQVEKILGPADKELNVAGIDYYAYTIEPFYEVHDLFPYWMISYQQGKVQSLQATGLSIPPNIHFSSINFGDEAQTVIDKLGQPSNKFKRRDNGYEVWEYKPYPFSIEFKQYQVYSIRIAAK
jgi:hypothetical protein